MTPYHTSERAIFYNGDCRIVMAEMEESSVDSIVCDPPYELSNDSKASPNRVILEFMFPKYSNVDPSTSSESKLPFLIDKVFGLTRSSIVPTPSSTVPVCSMTFDDDVSARDENIIDAEECSIGVSDSKGVNEKKSKSAEYIGCFYLELTDTAAFFKALNSAGTGFYAGGIGVGFGIESASFPNLLADSRVVRGSDTNIGNIDDSLSNLVGALVGTTGDPVFSFGLRRGSIETCSTHAACVFLTILQLTGAKLVAAISTTSGLSAKFESRRVSVVNPSTGRTLSFDLIVCPQEISSKGFMGKEWDGSKIAYDVAMWQEALRVLKPGGHLLAFGGSRTYHRLACAVEDAGFEIRDQIMWVYGSGFPKSLDVSKAIDKSAGAIREAGVAGRYASRRPQESVVALNTYADGIGDAESALITLPITDEAKQWDGWGTALKPAHEPIVVARKPLIGTVVENVLKHGTGALNIDGCRIETNDSLGGGDQSPNTKVKVEGWNRPWMQDEKAKAAHAERVNESVEKAEHLGRWPANLIHDGSDEVLVLFPDSKGTSNGGKTERTGKGSEEYWGEGGGGFKGGRSIVAHDDDGSAARFFKEVSVSEDEYIPNYKNNVFGEGMGGGSHPGFGDGGSAARFFYCTKADRGDRDEGLEGFPLQACGMMEDDEYDIKTGSGKSRDTQRRNHHPTVKPTHLMRYLCRLVTRPGGTVLDPFMGSGSTFKAAYQEGFKFIGIELQEPYCAIAINRVAQNVFDFTLDKSAG